MEKTIPKNVHLLKITPGRELIEKEQLDNFRAVTRNLTIDSLKVLEEIEGSMIIDEQSQDLLEKCYLLRHYLDYLRRFCEGKV